MKKILLMLLISCSLLASQVPENVDQSIRAWVKKTYNVNDYGSSMQKMMYEEEIKNYLWLMKYAEDKETLKRVMSMYPPNEWGYSMVKMMYEEEVKNNNW